MPSIEFLSLRSVFLAISTKGDGSLSTGMILCKVSPRPGWMRVPAMLCLGISHHGSRIE